MKKRYIAAAIAVKTAILGLWLLVWFKDRRKQRQVTEGEMEEVAILRPLHAFNEMEVLKLAGRHGWHSVDYGVLFHVVAHDDRQWEHARTLRGKVPYGEGWVRVGDSWGWWSYYARPLNVPALPVHQFTSGLLRTG